MSLEEKLAKIKSPNLQSQHHTRVVLESIEETLREQATDSPTAYFAALLALLKQNQSATADAAQDELTTSTVYLLDLVTSHVPASLLRNQFITIVTLLAPTLNPEINNSPLIRSAIGCLESVLIAQDSAAWNLPQSQVGPRQAVTALLSLAVDGRPKIRKRAAQALTEVLKKPPPGPSIDHPAAQLCATAVQSNLKSAVDGVHQSRTQKGRPSDSHDPAIIHALQLTKTVAVASNGWPSTKIEELCETLLGISRSRNDYLVMGAFEVFEVIFDGMQDDVYAVKLPRLLDAIVELKPAANDSQLVPPWIAILSRGYGTYAELDPEEVMAKLPDLFDIASSFLMSPAHNIRVSASECLISFFANCIPDAAILVPSIYHEKVLQQVADRALGLLAVKFQTAWVEVFDILASLFDALRWRGDPYLLPVVKSIGELRSHDGFQGQKQADRVLGHAIRCIGPRSVLNVLPHNLIQSGKSQPGRAWLLPLLRDHVSNTDLQHFKDELIPLSEVMYQRVIDHGSVEKTMHIKIFETVIQQVWAALPGYCDAPLDLRTSMDQAFAEMISNILYKQTELRVDICRALQNLVESNQQIVDADASDDVLQVERRMGKSDAAKNISHLATFASNLLAVLFNVYSQTLPQSRAYILQCINAYLSITPEADLVATFDRVAAMLGSALPAADTLATKKQTQQPVKDKLPPTSHTLLDLVIAMSIHLPRSTFGKLFTIASNILTNPSIFTSDPQLIKKAYKLIPRLATSDMGRTALQARNAELQTLILATREKTPVPARRDRLSAMNTLIPFLPESDLHFIPSVLSEIVLACKDTNEKARAAGFDTLLTATAKIADLEGDTGVVIRNSKATDMPDSAPDALPSLEEVFTMVSAGLAGVAPHMVAASITALSRLLFEYNKDQRLTQKVKEELTDTVTMFLQSNNREIVRAVLGFVKVMVVVLPVFTLEPRCEKLIPGLMIWSKENKGRLRAKVKGILERLIRRFGGAQVEAWVGDQDRKMVVNIRKRRERSRRKKKESGELDSDDNAAESRMTNSNGAFDETMYGSDMSDSDHEGSDVDGSGDDVSMSGVSLKSDLKSQPGKRNRKQKDQYIRQDEEEDEPLDLLDPKSIASISSSRRMLPKHANSGLPGQAKLKARYNEDGKLLFDGDGNASGQTGRGNRNKPRADPDIEESEAAQGDAINAYLDAVDGPDAVRRGQKGRLKVKSGMQRASATVSQPGRTEDDMDLDVDEAREVARQIMRGSGSSPRSPSSPGASVGGKTRNQRRGLGQEKQKHQPSQSGRGGGRGMRMRGGSRGGGVKKGVRFSRHPRR